MPGSKSQEEKQELWQRTNHPKTLANTAWPTFDPEAAKEDEITLVVQVNGKLRSKIQVAAGLDDAILQEKALTDDKVQKFIEDKTIRKVIVVKNKLINIVV